MHQSTRTNVGTIQIGQVLASGPNVQIDTTRLVGLRTVAVHVRVHWFVNPVRYEYRLLSDAFFVLHQQTV